jgi:hypothetical protein
MRLEIDRLRAELVAADIRFTVARAQSKHWAGECDKLRAQLAPSPPREHELTGEEWIRLDAMLRERHAYPVVPGDRALLAKVNTEAVRAAAKARKP